jgi:hypothetical protein
VAPDRGMNRGASVPQTLDQIIVLCEQALFYEEPLRREHLQHYLPELIERLAKPDRLAVMDYTERARLFANQTYTGPDAYARYRKALADEFATVASEHQAEIARLRKELAEVGDEAGRLAAQYQALSGIIDSLRVADDANAKAALLARLREPEMREAVAKAIYETMPVGVRQRCFVCADAALAVITEKLT